MTRSYCTHSPYARALHLWKTCTPTIGVYLRVNHLIDRRNLQLSTILVAQVQLSSCLPPAAAMTGTSLGPRPLCQPRARRPCHLALVKSMLVRTERLPCRKATWVNSFCLGSTTVRLWMTWIGEPKLAHHPMFSLMCQLQNSSMLLLPPL